jgi:GNAT superfamily N-acetyltransferase
MVRFPDMELEELSVEDRAEVQALAEACEDYYIETEGHRPGQTEAMTILSELPGGSAHETKHVFGVRDPDGALVAIVDLVHGWPDADTSMIGLMLVAPDHRDHGLGGALVEHIAQEAADAGAGRLRVAVYAERPAAVRFWERHGFVRVDALDRETESGARELLVMVRDLGRSTGAER